ncbi:hypothetical protein J4231_00535 [Candidatus Woesearchaeota archaeon]|nr:hypothetical protein [Candidatus Woesearchaeota archaeon]
MHPEYSKKEQDRFIENLGGPTPENILIEYFLSYACMNPLSVEHLRCATEPEVKNLESSIRNLEKVGIITNDGVYCRLNLDNANTKKLLEMMYISRIEEAQIK